jgi:hypothetical protein
MVSWAAATASFLSVQFDPLDQHAPAILQYRFIDVIFLCRVRPGLERKFSLAAEPNGYSRPEGVQSGTGFRY